MYLSKRFEIIDQSRNLPHTCRFWKGYQEITLSTGILLKSNLQQIRKKLGYCDFTILLQSSPLCYTFGSITDCRPVGAGNKTLKLFLYTLVQSSGSPFIHTTLWPSASPSWSISPPAWEQKSMDFLSPGDREERPLTTNRKLEGKGQRGVGKN